MSFCTIVVYIENLNYLNIIADVLFSINDRFIQFEMYDNDFSVCTKLENSK